MSEDQELFDRSLLRRRRARFAAEKRQSMSFCSPMSRPRLPSASGRSSRLPLALDLGAYHGLLAAPWRLSLVGEIDLCRKRAFARGPLPASCCRLRRGDAAVQRDEPQSGGFGLALHRVNDLPGAAAIQIRRSLARRAVHGRRLAARCNCRSFGQVLNSEAEAELVAESKPRVAPFADVREFGALLQRASRASGDRR